MLSKPRFFIYLSIENNLIEGNDRLCRAGGNVKLAVDNTDILRLEVLGDLNSNGSDVFSTRRVNLNVGVILFTADSLTSQLVDIIFICTVSLNGLSDVLSRLL